MATTISAANHSSEIARRDHTTEPVCTSDTSSSVAGTPENALADPGYFSRTISTESSADNRMENAEMLAADIENNSAEDFLRTKTAVDQIQQPCDSFNNNKSHVEKPVSLPTANDSATGCGPDQVVDADSLWTCRRDCAVRLRIGSDKNNVSAEPPVSIVTAFRQTVKRYGGHTALAAKVNGSWKYWNFQQYYNDVWTAAKAFIQLGLQPFNGVGIIGFNSPEWFIADVGAIFAGGLATGIYTTNSPDACHFVIENANCDVVVVENEAQLKKIRQVWNQLPNLKAVVQYNGQPVVDQNCPGQVYSWAEFMKLAELVPDAVLEKRISQQAINKCCTLIYTSGTTGNPKGVMLSQDNLIWTAKTACKAVGLGDASEILVSYLPLSHVAAQVLDIYIPILHAATVYFAQPDALKGSLNDTLREVRPTAFLGVPRVWEKIQEKMISLSARQGFVKRSVLTFARAIGLRGNMSLMNGGSLPYGWSLASTLVFRKIRAALGLDRCRFCLTAAAPITRDTLEFFMSLDMTLLEIYGMSESSGPHTISRPACHRITSAGTTMPGSELYLANPDNDGCGEVCMSGRNVFMGYLDEETKTKETIDEEGRLHSGDIGKLDADGFLFITGRIKELLITAGGENVAPVPIEDAVRESLPCVSNCMLIGDKRKFLSILLTLKSEVDKETSEPLDKLSHATIEWLRSNGCRSTYMTVTDVLTACNAAVGNGEGAVVRAAIQAGIDRSNKLAPSRAQNIQKWTILPRDFSIAGGELGPTLKLKRPFVSKMYEATINAMYEESM